MRLSQKSVWLSYWTCRNIDNQNVNLRQAQAWHFD